ncbi:MAG: DNA-protecting protein DprA [Candidatus Tectomicrobia bacterium]|uniref:DNA-protecting protein DprA n=1 Tax=Tectimicrobiota bacterium TaxID=2528274 RepID=A0A932CQR1_UNCTE|nr:DNA-protecting protein DprA [Candidatus Tectomicrobia bacterium]
MGGDERAYWVALSLIPRVGRVLFKRLVDRFGSPKSVLSAPWGQLAQVEGIGEKTAREIAAFDWERDLERELDQIEKRQISLITLPDPTYPSPLRTIPDPPPLLYVQGTWEESDALAIALVGSRSPTSYGKLMAERLSQGLAELGIVVVSGLARGIDTYAHRGTLAAGGRTLAVLGCGLGVTYPPESGPLREEIRRAGAVLSEFPLFTKPERLNFPVRNRLISGLSLGTLVVEAAAQSGALITAHFALDQGREVFAVPGPAYSPKSKGTHRLIKLGAKLVEGVEDILEELPPEFLKGLRDRLIPQEERRPPELSPEEASIVQAIPEEGGHIDLIIRNSQLLPSQVSGILVMLELKGLVKQLPGKVFLRAG